MLSHPARLKDVINAISTSPTTSIQPMRINALDRGILTVSRNNRTKTAAAAYMVWSL